jgi:hypothetical protein
LAARGCPERALLDKYRTMDARSIAPLVIALGIVIVLIGVIALAGGLSWFGRLPGDIRYRSNGTRIYVPITSMLLVSLVLSFVFAFVRRLTS